MMKIFTTIIKSGILLLFACQDTSKTIASEAEQLDYNNVSILDSLVKIRPIKEDTLFLGFKIGMSLKEYNQHANTIKKDGRLIEFSKKIILNTSIGRIDLGEGYTFTTSIIKKTNEKNITGKGTYYLRPKFSKNDKLISLNIYPIEEWNSIAITDNQTWLRENIISNSGRLLDRKLIRAMKNAEIISTSDFVQQNGNLLIYPIMFGISYEPSQVVFSKIKTKINVDSLIELNNKEIVF